MRTKSIAILISIGSAVAVLALLAPRPAGEEAHHKKDVHSFDPARPVIVTVRGWLWEPSSRRTTPRLERFTAQVTEALREGYSLTPEVVQFDWSRIPKDVVSAGDDFASFARDLSDRAEREGRCVAFVGHSAGAAMVWGAAANGTHMGYLGTLGLPTFGKEKPSTVGRWANFYTTTHIDDVAGMLWGSQMRADVNVDLQMRHKDFWESQVVAHETAAGVAETWIC